MYFFKKKSILIVPYDPTCLFVATIVGWCAVPVAVAGSLDAGATVVKVAVDVVEAVAIEVADVAAVVV